MQHSLQNDTLRMIAFELTAASSTHAVTAK